MSNNKNTVFPSLRAQMGDWTYYITLMSFADVAQWVKRASEIQEKKELKTWIQRDITEKRLESISNYLTKQPQRLFNALVVGIYGGDPDWFPVRIEDNPGSNFELNDLTEYSAGVLTLQGQEQIFAIDGQHRVEGIKEAIRAKPSLGKEQQCVIFVGHSTTDAGRKRTRRLFTTLNKYARPVSEGEIVALDEDDAFAIVTRRIMEDYSPLKGFIAFTKAGPALPTNDLSSITTTVALYQLIPIIALPSGSREKSTLKIGPPDDKRNAEIYRQHCEFWDLLTKYTPAVRNVLESKPKENKAAEYRDKGGHLLFRPVGQYTFARAVRVLMDRNMPMAEAIKLLCSQEMNLNSEPWLKVLWNPSTNNMLTKYKLLAQNLFLHLIGQKPSPLNYDLLAQYRTVKEMPKAKLPLVLKRR
jgi:DNA sulfur modification protein DndB